MQGEAGRDIVTYMQPYKSDHQKIELKGDNNF